MRTKDKTEPWTHTQAIILAGGSGTRLWPLSRALLPKQFLALNGDQTLLQQTVARTLQVLPAKQIWVVTNEEHTFEVHNQLQELSADLATQILSEPMGRNTLPAIVLALDKIVALDPEAVFTVFPSDHLVHDQQEWIKALALARDLAQKGWFVTFGIKPDKPETGYGYIEQGPSLCSHCYQVQRFVEKPNLEKAREFIASGKFLWNSGMFMFKASAFLEALEKYQPELWQWWKKRKKLPLAQSYSSLPDLSVDYGIMELVDKQAVVMADFGWDDLGSWDALYRLGNKDANGCVQKGDVLSLNCENCLFFSDGSKLAVTGVKDLIVVQTRDATLVCPLDRVQNVKKVVNELKKSKSRLIEAHLTVNRPWGTYTVLEEGQNYKIKRIQVNPGAKLSLQLHYHRSEHWIVISGTAEVQIGEQTLICTENQSVDIPKATPHRLSNPGRVSVQIIEIQSGLYLEEDDIVRFADEYGRNTIG